MTIAVKYHKRIKGLIALALGAGMMLAAAVQAHHSFAMYDTKITMIFTGVVTRVVPAPNHLKIFFALMNDERNGVERDADDSPVIWSVEMGGSAQMARQGISVNTFPPGTIFSVGLHPLRSGRAAGAREGGMFKCPDKTPPEAGMHCDSVEGHTAIGGEPLPEATH